MSQTYLAISLQERLIQVLLNNNDRRQNSTFSIDAIHDNDNNSELKISDILRSFLSSKAGDYQKMHVADAKLPPATVANGIEGTFPNHATAYMVVLWLSMVADGIVSSNDNKDMNQLTNRIRWVGNLAVTESNKKALMKPSQFLSKMIDYYGYDDVFESYLATLDQDTKTVTDKSTAYGRDPKLQKHLLGEIGRLRQYAQALRDKLRPLLEITWMDRHKLVRAARAVTNGDDISQVLQHEKNGKKTTLELFVLPKPKTTTNISAHIKKDNYKEVTAKPSTPLMKPKELMTSVLRIYGANIDSSNKNKLSTSFDKYLKDLRPETTDVTMTSFVQYAQGLKELIVATYKILGEDVQTQKIIDVVSVIVINSIPEVCVHLGKTVCRDKLLGKGKMIPVQ